MATRVLGSSIKRREDPRLITGHGTFVDNLQLPGMLYAAIVRSPHGHANIRGVNTAAAHAHPEVVAVYTGADFQKAGVGSLPCGWNLPTLKMPPHPPVAFEKVRYAGDAVAVVLAESPYGARDGAELVEVDYEPLDSVVDPKQAVESGAPQLHADVPDNVAFTWSIGDKDATDAAFNAAAKTAKVHLVNNRLVPNAIEPRAAVAQYISHNDEVTVWMTSQNPHIHRLLMGAFVLGIPEHKLRIIAPDVGGGFGSKIHHYAEEAIVTWCAKQIGRPVKWTSDRREAFLTDAHGRDHVTDAEMAFDKDGKIVGFRVKTYAGLGAYLSTFSTAVPTYLYGTLLSGEYTIPTIYCEVTGSFTNTVPVDAYRGAGRPEATYVVERLVDMGAKELGVDPAEIRRRNFVPPDAFPYQTPVALQYDSGNYEGALNRALEKLDYKGLRAEQAEAAKAGKLMGIGFSTYIEACGLAPSAVVGSLGAQAGQWESGVIRVHPTGKVSALTGSHTHGQGHETTFAQIVADELSIPVDDVEVIHGDTGRLPYGWGTYGSRSAAVGGSALVTSCRKVKEKAKKIAAHLLEANEADVEFADGKFTVKGVPTATKAWGEVVLMAYLAHNLPAGMEPGLEESTFYDPPNFTYPFGTHVAVVEIDKETGKVTLKRYLAVDDVGNVINPMIVDGQLHGGIVQGVGQALYEGCVYDENGQLLTGSMLDYAMPKADEFPMFELDRTTTPCPHNPLGVKGVGEAGAIASPAAVVNAVVDALSAYGVKHIDMPVTAEKVWQVINGK